MVNRTDTALPISSIQNAFENASERTAETGGQGQSPGFQTLLEKADEEVSIRFSNHARKRVEARGIPLTKDDIALLTEGVQKASDKGSKESLLLMDDTAFIVNVRERTVITALDTEGMKEKTFTNIDSAILLTRT